jgi:hypothetical protein
MRQLQRELKLISIDSMATHYIKIYSSITDVAIDTITLEPNQTLQRIPIFHLKDNYIAHECFVYNNDGSTARQYWLNSPLSNEVFEQK